MNLRRLIPSPVPVATAPAGAAGIAAGPTEPAAPSRPTTDTVRTDSRSGPVPAAAIRMRPLVIRGSRPGPQLTVINAGPLRSSLSNVATQLNPLNPYGLVGEYTSLPAAPTETAHHLTVLTNNLLFDHSRTPKERFLEAREHSQAAGKLLFSITSIPAVFNIATNMLPTFTGLYSVTQQFRYSHTGRFMNDLLRIARPIGDTVLLVGDSMHLHETLHEAGATTGERVRAAVDVGIDATRVASYLLPKTPVVNAVASAALFARVGLGLYDVHAAQTAASIR